MAIISKSDLPIYNALLNHRDLKRAPFHTPGHKQRYREIFGDLLSLDYTELEDTDSLYEACGCILKAEQMAARLFECRRTLFSAGGCTLAIQAMLRLVCPQGGKIICSRVVHRSAVNAMCLLGIDPVFVYPRADAGPYLAGRIHRDDIRDVLRDNSDARAVYITSPDYYGVMSDIEGIAKECKKHGVPLIVDNAHGAHLKFLDGKLHPIDLGAAMTACSAHKTLPVLTGGAFLNINDDRFIDDSKGAMAVFGSTSPSYPIMASLDICRDWLFKNGRSEYSRISERVGHIKDFAQSRGILVPGGLCDPVRISLNTYSIGIGGHEAADIFREYGVEPEYYDDKYIVLIASPFNTDSDFAKLEKAIKSLEVKKVSQGSAIDIPKVSRDMSLRDAFLSKNEKVHLERAVGRVAAEVLCPCPPGVPVVMPGEIIDENVVNLLSGYGFFEIKVLL